MGGTLAAVNSIYASTTTPTPTPGPSNPGPWRPPQWTSNPPALTLTATNPTAATSQSGQSSQTAYVFDSVINAEHEEKCTVTLNPVQTGAALTDNAFIVPPTLSIELLMSDAMQAFTVGQWSNAPSKSVSAYQTLIALMEQKLPVQVATRLRQYSNMMITSVRSEEVKETRYSLRCWVTFTNILTAQIENVQSNLVSGSADNSTLPQTTGQTLGGQTQTQPVPSTVESNDNIANAPAAGVDLSGVPTVPGAGTFTSTGMGPLGNVVNA